jgi:hypothetical protein
MFYVAILLVLGLLQFSIRSFLEIDAMTKSKYVAENYINKKNVGADLDMSKVFRGKIE